MQLEDYLEIILITYNRKQYLRKTLDALLAVNSPVKNVKITILDNSSTDGTSDLVEEYARLYKNLMHIRHKKNIGGDVNICKAYEAAEKEYAWILCDDDEYSWEAWAEVEEFIRKKGYCICVSGSTVNSMRELDDEAKAIREITFVPSLIFRTELLTSAVIMSMYKTCFTTLSQLRLPIHCVNNNYKIEHTSVPIVLRNKLNTPAIRGYAQDEVPRIMAASSFLHGYAIAIYDIKDENLREKTLRVYTDKNYPKYELLDFIKHRLEKTGMETLYAAMLMCLNTKDRLRIKKIQHTLINLYIVDGFDKKTLYLNILGKWRVKLFSWRRK